MNKVAIICKYLPNYRLAVFNQLSQIKNPKYEIIADTRGKEGIETIPIHYLKALPENGGVTWLCSKSFYYKRSLQYWQTNVFNRIFSKNYQLFVFDGAISHITTWIFSILCRLARKKVLFWTHGLKGTDKGVKNILKTIFFHYLPHGLIIYGNFSKEIMSQKGFNPDKIFVIGNSLNYLKQKQLRLELTKNKNVLLEYKKSILNDYKTIIFIGRLIPNKKVDKIISLVYDLKQENIYLNCIIIGNGENKDHLTRLISQNDLTAQFYFAGPVYDEEEIAKLFLISDLMLSPGNVGLNCIHSLAYGIPVITHDNFSYQNPEIEAINHGKNGLLYRFDDYTDMKEKVRDWFLSEHPNILEECLEPIEKKYNPINHARLINHAVSNFLKSEASTS